MDILTVGGLILAFTMFIVAFFMEGGEFSSLIQVTAAMIVFGGTMGAVLASFKMENLKRLLKDLKLVLFSTPSNKLEILDRLAELGDKARRSGILSLEEEIPKQENRTIKKGLELIASGLDKELIEEALARQIELEEKEYHTSAAMLESAGGYSPTMGIIGTVMGLVSLLNGLAEMTMGELGHAIAVAFIATLYGVCFANVVYIPFATKIKNYAKGEAEVSEMIIAGILSIQAGENPKVMKDKLGYNLIAEMQGIDVEAKEAAEKAARRAAQGQ